MPRLLQMIITGADLRAHGKRGLDVVEVDELDEQPTDHFRLAVPGHLLPCAVQRPEVSALTRRREEVVRGIEEPTRLVKGGGRRETSRARCSQSEPVPAPGPDQGFGTLQGDSSRFLPWSYGAGYIRPNHIS